MQQFILSSLSEQNPDIDELASIVDERWKFFFPFIDEEEKNRRDAQTIISLLLFGIHFHVLQTRGENVTLQKPDTNTEGNFEPLEKSLKDIVDWAFA